jgi:DeoR/GlpR family transcriptional regulator of sugar metabolism
MLTSERRDLILAQLRTHGRVLAADLVGEFGVSPDTVRRDLRELGEAGLVRRVHGGALPPLGDTAPFAERTRRAPEAKATIARRAAGLASDGQVIVIDGGTTTLEIARALAPQLRATVITNCLPIALELASHSGVEVSLAGGRLRRAAQVTVGPDAIQALRSVRADLLYLGLCGLHPQTGVTVEDSDERAVKAAMIDGAADIVGLADHDKLGTALPFVVAPLSSLTHLITDREADPSALDPYRALGIEVLTA